MSETPQKARLVSFKAKDVIIKEGARDRFLYVIRSGSVRVYKTYLGRKLTLAILGKGEVFGELSFFDGQPRIANVEAVDAGEVLVIDGEQVQADLENLPPWMPGVFKTIISRLRETDGKLTLLKNKYDLGSNSKDNDLITREILSETLRISKILKLYFSNTSGGVSKEIDQSIEELGILFGSTFLKVEKILMAFQREGYISEHDENSLELNIKEIDDLTYYLECKLDASEIWILSRSSLRFLSEVLDQTKKQNKQFNEASLMSDVFETTTLEKFINYDDFYREAKAFGILTKEAIQIKINDIENHLKFQALMANYNVRVD